MARKETKSNGYYRTRVTDPSGKRVAVYGKTIKERDEKLAALRSAWRIQEASAEQIYVVDYCRVWFEARKANMPEDARRRHRRNINNAICPVIGSRLLSEITPDDLEAVLATGAGKSKSYQKKLVGTVKNIFAAATAAGKLQRDPSLALKAGGRVSPPRRALTPAQQETLLEAVQGLSVELFVWVGLYTGMRREEILGLAWGDVELDGAAPHVVVRQALRWPDNHVPEISGELKTPAAYRTIPIPPQLVAQLRAARARETGTAAQISRRCVIHGRDGKPLTYSAFRSRWAQVTCRSTSSGRELGEKVPKHNVIVSMDFECTPHTMRHTYITRLILGGVDLKRVQYLAGHDDPEVTLKIYTELMGHQPEDLIGSVLSVFAPETVAQSVAHPAAGAEK